ncbi:ADP-ribosylation factor GTPase-activating protein agd4 [Mortierella sp. NVP85]|nr:ADP-ribosylation factor GTPase-activating protein agd4 [Mortierella sp. NVP85]
MNVLELKACKEDTPDFRKQVNEHEDAVVALETTVRSLLKLSKASVDLAQEYSSKQLQMAEDMLAVAQSQRGHDNVVTKALETFSRALQNLERSRSMMNTQITQMFIEPMETFLNQEVIPVREAKKSFQKASDDVDNALYRYMSKRARDQSIPEASKDVADARKKMHIEYIDYCIKLNELHAKEKFEFVEHIVTYMYTLSSFHHRAHDVMVNAESSMAATTENIQAARLRFTEERPIIKAVRDETLNICLGMGTHIAETDILCDQVGNEVYYPLRPFGDGTEIRTHATTKSGYLYKKGPQRVMASWSRRYFVIEGELLSYTTRGPVLKYDSDASMVINLRVCTVKTIENGDRPHMFEVISPMRIHYLQAENLEDMQEWVCCLQNAITAAHNSEDAPEVQGFGDNDKSRHLYPLHGSPNLNGNTDQDKQLLLQVRKIPGNEICADCRSLSPMWASVNHGNVLCIECSGIHRSLGVHVSKVRSLNLDKWETETVGLMLKLGNEKTNKIFEARILSGDEERWISVNSDRAERERFIIAKYIKKEFINEGEDMKEFVSRSVHEAFWAAMDASDYCEALRCLALGANIDHHNDDHGSMTALHRAIARRDDIAVEFLYQWFCDINITDGQGWTAMHHAVSVGNTKVITTLIKRHAKYDVRNRNGETPMDLARALEKSEALIVLQIYQFEQQQTEQTRPTSSLTGINSSSSMHTPSIPSPSSSLTGSSSLPTSFSEPAGFGSGESGSLPPLVIPAPSSTNVSVSAATSVENGIPAGISPKPKDSKPNLSSRNSIGTSTLAGKPTASDTTPARFSMADSRSLAAAMAANNPWAEDLDTLKESAEGEGVSTNDHDIMV